MRVWNMLRCGGVAAIVGFLVIATPAAADQCDNGRHVSNPHCDAPLTATPELDSIVLFGTGLAGAAGYALTRIRARRRD
jgi:hypothetical protein